MNSASDVSPAKFFTGAAMDAATDSHNARSALEPKMATDRAEFARDLVRRFREPLRQPALGGPVGGPGTHADDDLAEPELTESFKARRARGGSAFQPDRGHSVRASRPGFRRGASVPGNRNVRAAGSRRASVPESRA